MVDTPLFAHKDWCRKYGKPFTLRIANDVLALAHDLKTDAPVPAAPEVIDAPDAAPSVPSSSEGSSGSTIDEDVTMSEPAPNKDRGKGRVTRASAPPVVPATQKMDYVAVPGMDTGSTTYLRAQALNSKRARGDKDVAIATASPPTSRTAHRLFPDGGLLEYSGSSLFSTSTCVDFSP
ncbi:hypothetical protein MD484_g8854, partial [Candolleomyces efflorescens]